MTAAPMPIKRRFWKNPLDDRELLREIIRPIAEELGIYFPGFGWHSFRREHLTVIQEESATTFEAMAQAGHSSPDVTALYTIVNLDRRQAAVERLQKRLFGGGKGSKAKVADTRRAR